MVAFVSSILLAVVLLGFVPYFAKRRPIGTPLTWGEAMVAATYAFFLMFWAYGVVPHLFLTWSDNELGWRSDNVVYGPFDILKPQALDGAFPMTISYQVVRDLLVVGLYVVFLGGQIALWAYWQGRGEKKKTADVVVSDYGRPLVKQS